MSIKKKAKADVTTPCASYLEMVDRAALPLALMGGTTAMRAAGRDYLPQEVAESDVAYKNRLNRSFLYNVYGQTVSNLVGRLFRNGLALEDVPTDLEEFCKDIDLSGRNLARFARDLIEDAFHPGVTYLLVDFPPAELGVDGKPLIRSKADEKAAGLRPYWVHIKQGNLLRWTSDIINGVETLTRVQIMEEVEEAAADNEWECICTAQVRVLYPGRWEIWRENATSKEWEIYTKGTTTLNFIPLIPVYTRRTGFMTGRPLLENLAETNLCHWQSSSDQRNLLHVARVPILFGAGFTEATGKVELGANRMIKNSNPEAKLTFVEHTGNAIGSGQTDLDKLEAQMAALAMEPLLAKQGGTQTATAAAIDTASSASNLQTIAEGLCDCIQSAFKMTLQWLGQDGSSTGTVELDCDFSTTLGDTQDLQALQFARTNNDLSREGYLEELKRRDVLRDEFDIEADAELRAGEGPTLPRTPGTPKNPEFGAPSGKTD